MSFLISFFGTIVIMYLLYVGICLTVKRAYTVLFKSQQYDKNMNQIPHANDEPYNK